MDLERLQSRQDRTVALKTVVERLQEVHDPNKLDATEMVAKW